MWKCAPGLWKGMNHEVGIIKVGLKRSPVSSTQGVDWQRAALRGL